MGLGLLLGGMLLGLGELIRHWNVVPQSGTTVLAQLTEGAVGHNRDLLSGPTRLPRPGGHNGLKCAHARD